VKVRRLAARNAKGRPIQQPTTCTPTPPAARDNVTGWFIYHCGGGVLLKPAPSCVGPECRGAGAGGTKALGYAGDLDAGSRGSFTQAGRLIGVTAMDGIEISKGLAQIDQLRADNQIDGYYAAAAKNAYLHQLGEEGERAAPFEEPSPFGRVLAPGALGKRYKGITGEDVGKSVGEACRCTPRKPDARDPVSGWLIYYVGTGVLLTPTPKCIGGGGKPQSFWARAWSNTLALVKPTPPVPPQPAPYVPGAPPVTLPPSAAPAPPAPPTTDVAIPAGALVQICKPGYVRLVYERDVAPFLAAGWTRC
jgi:hypothetical protein